MTIVSKGRRSLVYGLLTTAGLGLLFAGAFVAVNVLNADLYGRLTETEAAGKVFSPRGNDPKIVIILHRILLDENAVEASVVVTLDSAKINEFKAEGLHSFRAEAIDASFQPYGLGGFINVDLDSPEVQRLGTVSLESGRFVLSSLPSVNGFPFDDVGVRILTMIRGSLGYGVAHFVEIEKMLPGRRLSVRMDGGVPYATLTRTSTEKFLVITSSIIFILLTVILALHLFGGSTPLNGLQEVLAMAGYFLGAAQFLGRYTAL